MNTFLSCWTTRRLPLLLVSALAGLFAAAMLIASARPMQAAGATEISIVVSPPTLTADGSSKASIIVTVSTGTVVMPGVPITFSLSSDTLGKIITVTATTDVFGTALSTWKAGTLAGSGQLIVSSDGIAATRDITLTAGPLVTITVSPSPATVTVGTTQLFSAAGVDQYGNSVPVTPTWTCNIGKIDNSGLFTAPTTVASGRLVTATSSGVSGVATVNIVAGSLASITVSPNPVNVTAGMTRTFSAAGYDQYNNPVPISPAWSTNGGGIDSTSGLFTAQPSVASGRLVTATSSGVSGVATVNIVAGSLASITVSPNPATVAAGATQLFRATGYDQYNNLVPVSPRWTTNGGRIGSTSGSFTAQTSVASGRLVTATSGSIRGVATVNIIAGSLTSLTVSPNPVDVAASTTVVFSAAGVDQYNNPVTVSPAWTTNGGTINSSGLFTAQLSIASGRLVTATSSGVNGIATVNIVAGSLASITVSPNPATVAAGATQLFSATGYDRYNNPVYVSPAWSTNGGGIDSISGLFTAQPSVASGRLVTATSGSIRGVATVNIVAGSVASITVSPNPATVVAGATQLFSAAGVDQYNNPVSISPAWSTNGGTINSNGLLTAQPSVASGRLVTATSGSVSGIATVNIVADSVNTITVQVDPPNLAPGSGATALITATAVDRFNNPVPGQQLTGALVPPSLGILSSLSPTDGYGQAFGTWTAGNVVVSGQLRVTYSGRTGTANIALSLSKPQTVSVQIASPTLFASSGMTSLITATVLDEYNNLIPNAAVSFSLVPSSTFGSVTGSATTDSSGRAIGTWTAEAGSLPGSGTVIANASSSLGSAVGSAPITLTADRPYSLTLQADPASPVAGIGSRLMATVLDRFGNKVGDGTTVTFTSDIGDVVPQVTTTVNGVALSHVNWIRVGAVHITASIGVADNSTTVNFVPDVKKVFLPVVMRNFPPIPTGTRVTVNSGAANTYQIAVTLEVSATVQADYIERMRFSNDLVNWGNWVTFAPTATWNLDPHNGLKTVYAQFAGHWGGVSAPISDTIFLFMDGDFAQPNLASWSLDPGNQLGVSIASEPGSLTSPAGLLGSPTYPCNNVPIGYGSISQYFVMPYVPAGQSLVLRFNYHIFTSDINVGLIDRYDQFNVLLNANLVFKDMNQDKTNKWPSPYPPPPPAACAVYDLGSQDKTVVVTGSPGSNINVTFRVYNRPDKYYNTYVYVDNVRLEFQGRSSDQSDEAPLLPETPAEHTGR